MLKHRLRSRLLSYKQLGVRRSSRMLSDRLALELLRLWYGFAPWHAQSPTSARPYREGLADLVSSLHPTCVVEVGCGLGAILSRVSASERFGYDVDGAAIRVARLLRGRSVTFIEGGFDAVTQPAIDVLIAVNWTHDFPPEQIEQWIAPLLPRCRYILLDAIDRSSPLAYRYYHDFAFLDGKAAIVRTDAFGEEHRRFILYEVHR